MRRKTHLMLGAATGTLVAASASLPMAAGAIWLGIAGGGFPDWLDLRSELRGSLRLRHRGASHGLPFTIGITAVVYLALRTVSEGVVGLPEWLQPSDATAERWTLAFGAGILSHLASDACTHAGIRPMLPLFQWRVWLLPRLFRSRSDGYLNTVALGISVAVIGVWIVLAISRALQAL